MPNSADFLGRGWAFSPTDGVHLDETGQIAEAGGEEKIRQSLLIILSTAPGERIGRPDFGCGIHDLVFSARNATTLGRVESSVRAAITRWEPRVELLAVAARLDPEDQRGLLVFIHYEVRATNSRFNLVYPFYLST